MVPVETQVLIIGAGVTGTGLARDLALRGVNCVVVEAGDVNAGASGANHGLLHSGARYVAADPVAAEECGIESRLLKLLAPGCIETTGGLFVAVPGDDEKYIADFPTLCEQRSIPVAAVGPRDALDLEPELARGVVAAYLVEDAAINPFRLSLENMAQAEAHGAHLLTHTKVTGFDCSDKHIRAVRLTQLRTGRELLVEAEQVVNAAGPWAGEIAALAGISLSMIYSKGTLLVTQTRLTSRVINRLRPPDDGDIVAPGGTVSVVGTTSVRLEKLASYGPTIEEVDFLVSETGKMVPRLAEMRFIRAFAGVRPLVASDERQADRAVPRGYVVLDHETEGLGNMVTVTGGKLTTFRLMAEKTADLVCSRLGVNTPCLTRVVPLSSTQATGWTEPAQAARIWLQGQTLNDPLLCQCEMVPASTVEQVLASLTARGESPDLNALSLRSRLGRGSCQGTFCGLRVIAHLYENGALSSNQGLRLLKEFAERRWHGLRPVLWGVQLAQGELQEALYCGQLALELQDQTAGKEETRTMAAE
jgi:glycerol-3-phosphate dehydrogenase